MNFKFFHQPGYGNNSSDEFNTTKNCKITTTSDIFMIDRTEDGNIKLRSGKTLTEGTTYIFTLDCSDPKNAVLTVSDAATAIQGVPSAIGHEGPIYNLQGHRISKPAKGIYIQNGQKHILP